MKYSNIKTGSRTLPDGAIEHYATLEVQAAFREGRDLRSCYQLSRDEIKEMLCAAIRRELYEGIYHSATEGMMRLRRDPAVLRAGGGEFHTAPGERLDDKICNAFAPFLRAGEELLPPRQEPKPADYGKLNREAKEILKSMPEPPRQPAHQGTYSTPRNENPPPPPPVMPEGNVPGT